MMNKGVPKVFLECLFMLYKIGVVSNEEKKGSISMSEVLNVEEIFGKSEKSRNR